ncbi:multicopper oxidase domain-containing protein [Terrabacter sp. C0L_2]|uniref:multicopper oxidase domain-containing protein n=1 Tax=Terrabacter sp. C0L_2 TaxID=3108389 RepID=UPI002ED687A9|nr:multicopper oxidase domain-containing protein [Terrabacter sp. C0L_2]
MTPGLEEPIPPETELHDDTSPFNGTLGDNFDGNLDGSLDGDADGHVDGQGTRRGPTSRRAVLAGAAGAAGAAGLGALLLRSAIGDAPVSAFATSGAAHPAGHAAVSGAGRALDPGGAGTATPVPDARMLSPATGHGAGVNGATFRTGQVVDHRANGFDPTAVLRDFDWGTTSRLSDGRTLREWDVVAGEREIEVAPGLRFPAWTFNARVPGPTLRCREGDRLRVRFVNASPHQHTMHFHGIHPAEMDGVPMVGRGTIAPGEEFVYEFDAEPFGLHLYHCHVGPLAEHISRGMYGTFIIDPAQGRPRADEMVMVQHGWNTTFDGQGNQLYAVNGIPFHYMHEPIRVKRGELVRIHLVNILEYDPINSFHVHGNFFDYYPTGTRLEPSEYTDTIVQGQGQRGICEMRFPHVGRYMFHAHKTEFADLGWMGFFEVVD